MRFGKDLLLLHAVMETETKSIEELIAAVLDDISQKGYSSVQPFSIGNVELRMSQFAAVNGIVLGSNELYMSAKQLQHCMRASKNAKGLVVDATELIDFPQTALQWICTMTENALSILTEYQNLSSIPITR